MCSQYHSYTIWETAFQSSVFQRVCWSLCISPPKAPPMWESPTKYLSLQFTITCSNHVATIMLTPLNLNDWLVSTQKSLTFSSLDEWPNHIHSVVSSPKSNQLKKMRCCWKGNHTGFPMILKFDSMNLPSFSETVKLIKFPNYLCGVYLHSWLLHHTIVCKKSNCTVNSFDHTSKGITSTKK